MKSGNITIKFNIPYPLNKFLHNLFFETFNNSEFHVTFFVAYQRKFDVCALRIVFLVKTYGNWNFVGVVRLIYKTIVKEKSWIALATVAIINLISTFDVVACFNYKTLFFIWVVPGCLSWPSMIQHISIWHKSICFNPIDCYTKYSRTGDHSQFRVFSNRKLRKRRYFSTNQFVINFDIFNFFVNLR